MTSIHVSLGIARTARNAQSSSGASSEENASPLTAELKQKIFERDDHTCGGCGFKSVKYQDVLFKNHNKADTKSQNLITTCIFCHQCFYLEQVSQMRSGVLVWLPEVEQTQLHHIARAIYVARISQGSVADAARRSLDIIMNRREEARKRLGTDDPYILATVLKDYITPKAYEMRTKKLGGIKLFPLDRRIIKEADLEFNQFPQILAYWRSKDGPFGGKIPKKWVELYRNVGGVKAA